MRPRLARALAALAVSGGAAGAGCSVKNPDFCCSTLASCQAAGLTALVSCGDPAAPYCDDDGEYGAPRACIADPGPRPCTGPADCTTPALPVCDVAGTGTCTGCAVEGDCVRFADTPHCAAGGACVECRTSVDCQAATAPVCGADNQCGPCTDDSQCATGVCGDDGQCPPADRIVYVDATAAAGNAECTMAAPCRTLAAGLAKVTTLRHTVVIAAGLYNEQVVLDGRTVDLVGRVGAELSSNTAAVVDIRNTATVSIRGLRVRGGTFRGVRCADSTVTLRAMSIENHAVRGLESNACTLTAERVRVLGNVGGGLSLVGGRVTIRNSFIGMNGSPAATTGGVYVMDPVDLTLEFNTIASNVVAGGNAAGLTCRAATLVRVTNNIIVGDGSDQVDAVPCAPTYTLSNESLPGATNVSGRPTFRNAGAGDFHLVAGSPGIDQADPAATLASDIDGEARPAGTRADLGADELH